MCLESQTRRHGLKPAWGLLEKPPTLQIYPHKSHCLRPEARYTRLMQAYLIPLMIGTLGVVILGAFVALLWRGWRWDPARVSSLRALRDVVAIMLAHPLIASLILLGLGQTGYTGNCQLLDPRMAECTRGQYTFLQLHHMQAVVPIFKVSAVLVLTLGLMLMLRLLNRRKARRI